MEGRWLVWLGDAEGADPFGRRPVRTLPTVDVATDEVIKISDHHPFDTYFRLGDPSALAPLRAALA